MFSGKTKTGFKIGGSVGIIILLLGVAVLFGLFQMDRVSQEVVQISEEFVPLNEIISDIKFQNLLQTMQLEKALQMYNTGNFENFIQVKNEFWKINDKIDFNIQRGKSIANTGIELSKSQTSIELLRFEEKLFEISKLHSNYETLTSEFFNELNEKNANEVNLLFSEIKTVESKLQNELDYSGILLTSLTEESTSQIELNEKNSLQGQIIIISIVGAIAASLGFFINQINRDLKKEVYTKTLELKKANEKLQKLDKKKNEFIGIASHELKSPIQPIIGFAELARAGDIDQKEAWDGVTELATKLQDLANAVLDVSKIENEQLVLQIEKNSINDIILDVTKSFKMNQKSLIRIQENLDENILIDIDKMRFEQVLRNLLNNSFKFMSKGTITVATHIYKEENKIQIRVSDTGRGIPKEILPKIFEKFVTKTSNLENTGGTGLGLYLCRGIIKAHGGGIFAYNNTGAGATFEFVLPISQKSKMPKVPKLFKV